MWTVPQFGKSDTTHTRARNTDERNSENDVQVDSSKDALLQTYGDVLAANGANTCYWGCLRATRLQTFRPDVSQPASVVTSGALLLLAGCVFWIYQIRAALLEGNVLLTTLRGGLAFAAFVSSIVHAVVHHRRLRGRDRSRAPSALSPFFP